MTARSYSDNDTLIIIDQKGEELTTVILNTPYNIVRGWVSIANGSYRKTEEGKKLETKDWEKMKENNPIQLIQ